MTPSARFVTDPSWRRPSQGNVVIAGSPLTIFSLSDSGKHIAETIEFGQPLSAGHEVLTERLLDAGAIHPIPESTHGASFRTTTVVIPAFVRSVAEAHQLRSLVTLCEEFFAVVVVDDCSPHALPDLGSSVVIRLNNNRGPAAARNAGLQQVSTDFVAFIDLDVSFSTASISKLFHYFADPKVALVAPRIRSFSHDSALAKYENATSVLDMGDTEARVAPETRLSYVPSAMLVCRTVALRSISGFDEAFRFGEDVDLVWRLNAAQWRCRYQPQAICTHLPRSSVWQFISQRMSYGASAAQLSRKHQGKLTPIQLSAWQASTWIFVLLGFPFIALGIALLASFSTIRKCKKFPHLRNDLFQVSLSGTAHSGLRLAELFSRTWWPIALIASLFSQRIRMLFLLSALGPAAYEWWKKRPQLDFIRFVLIKIVDNAAYGAGVWKGAFTQRTIQVLLPTVKRSVQSAQ